MYHRGHLSLYPQTTVYLAPVYGEGAAERRFPELLGTTIQEVAWPSVYRLALSLYDRGGVLHDTLASVARHGGNVLNLDSSSIDQESVHHVEMVVDFASLGSSELKSESSHQDFSREIEGLLLADCYRDLVEQNRRFAIRIAPMNTLRDLSARLAILRATGLDRVVHETQIRDKGGLEIVEDLQYFLRCTPDGRSVDLTPPLNYFITSDTTERVFRISFVPRRQEVVWCAIKHPDLKGALSLITDALRKDGFTVLTALNRVQKHNGVNWFELILSKAKWNPDNATREQREEQVKLVLGDETLDRFDLEVFFDRREARDRMRRHSDKPAKGIRANKRMSIEEWLTDREEELEALGEEVRGAGSGAKADARLLTLRRQQGALQSGIEVVRRENQIFRPNLFLSLEFHANQAWIAVARSISKEMGADLDVVDRSKGHPVIMDEVRSRIEKATHFIGLWTPSVKEGLEGSRRPSPWCLWEWGVAYAFEKKSAILIATGTNPLDYETVRGEVFKFTFDSEREGDFETAFRDACRSLFQDRSPLGPLRG